MRAALSARHGPAMQALGVVDTERPEPKPGEVRIKIEHSGVNPTDWKTRSGAPPRPMHGFQIPHHDGAGVIDAVGEGVDPGRIGERVWTYLAASGRQWGMAAELTGVPADQAGPLPGGVCAELGACLGVSSMTPERGLFPEGPTGRKPV